MRIRRDRDVQIVGVGQSDSFGFDIGKSPMRLQAEALHAALADAGLPREAVDGFSTATGSPAGVDYDEFAAAYGLDCRWVEQLWAHGRWATTSVVHAELAIHADLADVVAICNTVTSGRGYGRYLAGLGESLSREGLRDMGGVHGEWDLAGLDTPCAATAVVAKKYMLKYGADSDDLARVCVGQRRNAALNPMSIMGRKELTLESYYDEPVIAAPFRRCDFSLTSEGSNCIIVAAGDRARSTAKKPITVAAAQGVKASRDGYILFARPGLGVGFSREFPWEYKRDRVYTESGLTQADIDALYVYDSFSSNVWMVLERFGFCGEGEAAAWIADRGISVGSPQPINSNGGLISEGHFSGYGHVIEMVRQLRGECGDRQIVGASAAQWATPWGDSMILVNG